VADRVAASLFGEAQFRPSLFCSGLSPLFLGLRRPSWLDVGSRRLAIGFSS
jgi:hypothetical protein